MNGGISDCPHHRVEVHKAGDSMAVSDRHFGMSGKQKAILFDIKHEAKREN